MYSLPQSFQCSFNYQLMVKSKFWKIIDREPTREFCIITTFNHIFILYNQSKESNGYDTLTLITVFVGESSQLFHIDAFHIGFFMKLSIGSIFGRLIFFQNKSTRKSPHTRIRIFSTLNQEEMKFFSIKSKNHRIGSNGRMPIGRFPFFCLFVILHFALRTFYAAKLHIIIETSKFYCVFFTLWGYFFWIFYILYVF